MHVMRKFFIFTTTFLFFTLALIACGTGKAHCDAYGDATNTIEESDLAELNQ